MNTCVQTRPDGQNSKAWKATLSLSFEDGPSRTFVRRAHKGPLSVQKPFYPESKVAHVYILHPPGGVVGSDQLHIDVHSNKDAAGLVTTPGATKFYRSNGQSSQVVQHIEASGGSLEWFPQENIFFDGCASSLNTTIILRDDSAFAGWDIQCYGRPAGGQTFKTGSVCNKLTVLIDDKPVLSDRIIVDGKHPLSQTTTFRNCTVNGTLIMNRMSSECCELVRSLLHNTPDFFATCIDSILVVRYLGNSAQEAKQGFCTVWSRLRHLLNGQPPCIPRIWAT